jgi:hypothetical protein
MPRDGSGIYTTPAGTTAVPDTTIESSKYNGNVADVAADLNAARPIIAGGTGANNAASACANIGAVAKAGDTMTGDLSITKAQPSLNLVKTASGQNSGIVAFTNATARWFFGFSNATAESGGNAGSDVGFTRYNDAGVAIDTPFSINRSTGNLGLTSTLLTTGRARFARAGIGSFEPANAGVVSIVAIPAAGEHGIAIRPSTDATYNAVIFENNASTICGQILVSATGTSYVTTSDAELKEDLKSFDAGNIIDDTNVYDFKWKSTGERDYGVVAQQATEVYPAAIHHDEKTDFWGVDYSKYVPVILQELKALRARVAELEGRTDEKPS